jgi:hypothetical protein
MKRQKAKEILLIEWFFYKEAPQLFARAISKRVFGRLACLIFKLQLFYIGKIRPLYRRDEYRCVDRFL